MLVAPVADLRNVVEVACGMEHCCARNEAGQLYCWGQNAHGQLGDGGVTEPFTEQQLLQLYPTHDDYVMKYKAASERAVAAGILLERDSKAAVEEAETAPIPN